MSAGRSVLLWRNVRDNRGCVELVKAGKVLATVQPSGHWYAFTLGGSGQAADLAAAKIEASAFVKRALEAAKSGES